MTTRTKALWIFAPVIAGGALLAGGCADSGAVYSHDEGPYTVSRERVVVVDPPPTERYEVVQPARPGYVWVHGHYRHDGRRYYWVNGHYERMPRSRSISSGR